MRMRINLPQFLMTKPTPTYEVLIIESLTNQNESNKVSSGQQVQGSLHLNTLPSERTPETPSA